MKALLLSLAVFTAAVPAAAQNLERLDDFRMRSGNATELRQVAPDLYFLYDDLSSNSAFLVTDEGLSLIHI